MTAIDSLTDWGIIHTQDNLDAFITAITAAPYLAIDTEFHRESTYTAKLALIQVATDQHLGCIDPLANLSLDPFVELLESDQPKLLHSIYQDAEILFTALGAKINAVFDTQVAAAFCGHPDQLSYRDAVEQATGVLIDKGESRSDWLRRPLRERQIDYAKLDVVYLAQIQAHYLAQLDETKQQWIWEESQRQATEATNLFNESVMLNRIKLRFPVAPEITTRLALLHCWREQQAYDEDKPRRWIVGDESLREIAELPDADSAAVLDILSKKVDVDSTLVQPIMETLAAADQETRTFPEINPIQDPECKQQIKALSTTCNDLATSAGISPTLVASRKMITAHVLGQPSLLTEGWRSTLLRSALDQSNASNNAD